MTVAKAFEVVAMFIALVKAELREPKTNAFKAEAAKLNL